MRSGYEKALVAARRPAPLEVWRDPVGPGFLTLHTFLRADRVSTTRAFACDPTDIHPAPVVRPSNRRVYKIVPTSFCSWSTRVGRSLYLVLGRLQSAVQAVEKLLWHGGNSIAHTYSTTEEHRTGCKKWPIARPFQLSLPFSRGVAEAALYCAHRTSTFLSCAFCEQEGHLAPPFPAGGLFQHPPRLGLRRFRAYGRVPSLHLERGKGLWPQNRKKDLSFGIGGAGVDPTVPLPLRLPHRRYSPTRSRHLPISTKVPASPSPFPPSSFRWAALP